MQSTSYRKNHHDPAVHKVRLHALGLFHSKFGPAKLLPNPHTIPLVVALGVVWASVVAFIIVFVNAFIITLFIVFVFALVV